jgi:hypothetical protein
VAVLLVDLEDATLLDLATFFLLVWVWRVLDLLLESVDLASLLPHPAATNIMANTGKKTQLFFIIPPPFLTSLYRQVRVKKTPQQKLRRFLINH